MSARRLGKLMFDIAAWITLIVMCGILTVGICRGVSRGYEVPVVVAPAGNPSVSLMADSALYTREPLEEPVVTVLDCTVVKVPVEDPVVLYNVPLEADLQRFIIGKAEGIGIDPAVIFAMAHKESTYNPNAIGDNGNSFGLMQIQPRWNMERMERLGCLDLLDPFQNVTVAVDLMGELMDKHGDIAVALTVYNNGHFPGYVTDYAKTILNTAEGLTKAVTVNEHP